jgi:membrane protein
MAFVSPFRCPVFRCLPPLRGVWHLLRDTVAGFVEDDALSRGAAIAYYTLFSLAPILLLAIAIAGLAFGRDAARGAIVEQLSGLMGGKSAEALQAMIESASDPKTGMTASLIGILEQSPR